jgi:hypothetical protein
VETAVEILHDVETPNVWRMRTIFLTGPSRASRRCPW